MIKGIVFDKDGTLFDFNATWGAWAHGLIEKEAGGDPETVLALSKSLGYSLETRRFLPGSVVIAEPVDKIAQAVTRVMPELETDALIARMNAEASQVPQVEATPLVSFVKDLKALGLVLGVATNDGEAPARHHLSTAGILEDMAFVAGYDSGYGSKPGAGQVLGFCDAVDLKPDQVIMVGDSLHDLCAAQAAGVRGIGVLTGPATADELAPAATAVLPSIAALPKWIKANT